MRKLVKVKSSYLGAHHYPNAPFEVKYLKLPHYHNFTYIIQVEVEHSNREIEYIMFKDVCESFIKSYWDQFKENCSTDSCEHMAEWIYNMMRDDGYNIYSVEVCEDDKFSSEVRRR